MRSTCFEARGLGGFVKAMCVGMLMMRRTMRRTMRKRMRKDEKWNEDDDDDDDDIDVWTIL